KIFNSIPPILWSVLIALFMLLSLSGLLSIAIGPLSRILLLIFAMYWVLSSGITWGLIKLTHLNHEAAPLILIGVVGLAIWVWASADESTPIVPGLVLIALGLAAIAQWFLYCNSWSKFGATMGALGTLCLTEAWAVFFKFYAMPINARWIFAVLSAILGCLIGAWIQQELTSFRAARLANTNFTTANLKLADFRDANIQQATFHRAQMKGIFLSNRRQLQLTTIAIRLSEQVTAYLQRFRT
ncbi:MAG: pentapeptide repeat-containing protein, partial [Cyanobacteria bacterium P01_H01_bin.152]